MFCIMTSLSFVTTDSACYFFLLEACWSREINFNDWYESLECKLIQENSVVCSVPFTLLAEFTRKLTIRCLKFGHIHFLQTCTLGVCLWMYLFAYQWVCIQYLACECICKVVCIYVIVIMWKHDNFSDFSWFNFLSGLITNGLCSLAWSVFEYVCVC